MRLYVDGVERYNNANAVSSRQVNDGHCYLGRRADGWSNANGRLDEVQVYSGARSADWMETYYAMTSDPASWATVSAEAPDLQSADLYHLGFRDYAPGAGEIHDGGPGAAGHELVHLRGKRAHRANGR